MNAPLPTLSAPLSFLGVGNLVFTPHEVAAVIFFVVAFFWLLYTLVAAYHWFRYSHASFVAIPALLVHVCVSAVLITFALSGL